MDKLTLKDIAPYLPYDLQVQYTFNDVVICYAPMVANLMGNNLTKEIPMALILDDNSPCKICLRPLYQLTQEIEHKGERFVPMLKILDILKIRFTQHVIVGNSIDLVLDWSHHKGNTRTKQPQKIRFWFNNHKGSGFNCTNMGLFLYKDMLGAIQKLHEWHFDVFGLIPRGLAIDKSTVKEVRNG